MLLPYVLGILGAGRYGGHDSSSIYDIRVHRPLLTGWGQERHSGSLVGVIPYRTYSGRYAAMEAYA